jgi:DNA-directed RNA polymerase subunit RPC12/RpoP
MVVFPTRIPPMITAFVQFPCPRCQRVIRTTTLMVGRAVTCPGCEYRPDVPPPAAPHRHEEATSDSSIGATRSPLYHPPA